MFEISTENKNLELRTIIIEYIIRDYIFIRLVGIGKWIN